MKKIRPALAVIAISTLLFLLLNWFPIGPFVNGFFPCETSISDSVYCYIKYDIFAGATLLLVITVSIVWLISAIVKSKNA